MSYEIIHVKLPQKNLIEEFLANAGNSLNKFRYFSSRSMEAALKNHLVTLIAMKGAQPVGYAHLDSEGGKVWLGTAVAESEKGKGVGTLLMQALLEEAKKRKVEKITLSVDNDNHIAATLYRKFGFYLLKKEERISYYETVVK